MDGIDFATPLTALPHSAVCDIVASEFATSASLGILWLREHRLFRAEFRLDEFAATLGEIFSR